ncbi:MAG: alpha/beta fold hydrolase [Ferruginibacter sp.]
MVKKNIIIPGSFGKTISLDISFLEADKKMPVVVYAHGFNGFKDWGNFDLVARQFAMQGFVFVKFNFSHNGTSPSIPQEFVDLDAFGNNNYSKQLEDLEQVINWVCDPQNIYQTYLDPNNVFLIGHSMGAGIAMLHTAKDKRIKKLISWAGISECKTPWGSWPADKMQEWKQAGVQYYLNGRTKQQMPLYYQLYEDYIQNEQTLNIENAIKEIDIPILICHGTLDIAVPIEKAFELKRWQPAAKLFTIESDHVFGRSHPWNDDKLPPAMEAVVEVSLRFLKL